MSYTKDDLRITLIRIKMYEAEERLLVLRSRLNDAIEQRRATLTGEVICPVCGRVDVPHLNSIPAHVTDNGRQCRGTGLALHDIRMEGGL